jgi:phosphate:Na+ symporter
MDRDQKHIDEIIKLDDKVDILEAAIFEYLGKIRHQSLTKEESKAHQDLMAATVNLETLADIIEGELSELGKKFLDKERHASETTREIFKKLFREVHSAVEHAVGAVQYNNQNLANEVLVKKDTIAHLADDLLERKSEGLGRDLSNQLETARLEISLVDKLRRTYTLAKRIAKIVIPKEVTKD